MKIQLDYKIDIEVKEQNKTKEKLSVFFREFTKAEKKEYESIKKRFESIFKKAQKISKKQESLQKRASLHELNGNYEKALECIEKKDALEEDVEELINDLDDIGGGNQEEFAENTAKERFNILVSGKGKEKLEHYAQIKGYAALMRDLDIAKSEIEKKQSGA